MMLKQEKAIPFHLFFMIEFMERVLQRARSRFTPHVVEIIEILANSLKTADDPILVLEKLAQFQETNDMSIFLFDMLGRIEKIPPKKSIDNLDGLSEDFINLYALMIEDRDAMTTLEVLTEDLKASGKEVLTEKPEKKKKVKTGRGLLEENLISFDEFYQQEAKLQLLSALPQEMHDDFTKFLKISLQEKASAETFAQPVSTLITLLRSIFPRSLNSVAPQKLMEQLGENLTKIVEEFQSLEKNHPELLEYIRENEALPTKPKAEETSEKTIDVLLKEYFRSEINDHIKLIKQTLNQPFSAKAMKNIIKYFKSLKEVSMIHGYTGVEYLCERLMEKLRAHATSIKSFTPSFMSAMNEILNAMESLDQFDYDVQNQKIKEEVDQYSDLLEKALTTATEEEEGLEKTETLVEDEKVQEPPERLEEEIETKEPPSIEEKTKPSATEKPQIGLEDRPQMVQVLRELLEGLSEKLQPFSASGQTKTFLKALQAISQSIKWIHGEIENIFFDSFLTIYENAIQGDFLRRNELLKTLENSWQIFLKELTPDLKFEKSKKFWETFNLEQFIVEKEETRFAAEDDRAIQALAESMQNLWRKKIEPLLTDSITKGDQNALQQLNEFVQLLSRNLRQLQLDSYLSLPSFFEDKFIRQGKRITNSTLVDEVRQAFELFFERLAEKGRQGNSKDLADVLDEVLAEEMVISETTAETISEDEQDFVSDSQRHLEEAKRLLQELVQSPEKRELFKTLAGEVHAVYSAAQFMNHESIADAAIVVEEAAEMFAAPEVSIPERFFEHMDEALSALQEMVKNKDTEKPEPFKALQEVLDQLVMEEPKVEQSKFEIEKEAIPKTVEEKPLFSTEDSDEKELMDIFKEDARNLLNTLVKANNALLRNPVDEEAIREFDQAVHSLKNAAKMTGLDDLALIFGRFEGISEQLKEHSSLSTKKLQEKISEALKALEPLIFKGELENNDMDSILSRLDELSSNVISAQKGEEERNKRLRMLFVEEAKEIISKINHDLIELEKVPESGTILAELLRHLHTLKGGAMMANFNKIGELAHKLEDYFQLYRGQNAETKLELLPTAFTIIDLISEMIRSVEKGQPERVSEFTARLADIDNKLFYLKDFEIPRELQQSQVKVDEKQPLATQDTDNTIKIKASFVDHLVNLATELVVNRTELSSYFETFKKLTTNLEHHKKDIRHFTHQFDDFLEESAFKNLKNVPPALEQDFDMLSKFADNLKDIADNFAQTSGSMSKLIRSVEKNVSQLSVLSKSLHSDLLKARMLPVRILFERFERPVRDLARQQKKQVELVIEDNGAELDRAMVEALYDPLLHIIRNAVDHGIEKPIQRKRLKKNPTGKIILRARQEKGQVVIDVIDDGQGIDPEKIRQKIVDLKIMKKEQAAKLTDSHLLEYIFAPEFTTSEKATDVSGRGIGLDVVISEIQKLKGIVRVKTNLNQGTVFSIRVPLTLIVSQAMLINFHEQTVAIPLIAVMESIEVGEQNILLDDKRSYVQVRGKLLPYVDIDAVLRLPDADSEPPRPKKTALILHDSGVSIALGIEEILGRQDIVIKSLGNLLQNVELISGGTILPSGEVALILDYAALIHQVETEFFGASREKQLVRKIISSKEKNKVPVSEGFIDQGQIIAKTISGRQPVVLVVDDAMSVQEFISSFLERNGFKTLKANDGKEALELIKKKPVDLLITDLEMPVMHGFDLIKKVRKMAQYKDLPIIILTAQAGKDFQAKGAEMGANAFISKPFKEGDLLRMMNAFIQVEPKN